MPATASRNLLDERLLSPPSGRQVLPDCVAAYPGGNWGDGTITISNVLKYYNLSDASPFFQLDARSAPALVLSPHM